MANELIIKISAESKEFTDAVKDIKDKTASLEGQLGSVAAVSGAVFTGLIASAGVAIHAFGESEKASKDLTLALQNQGIASNELIARYKGLADAISAKTGVDDDAIISGTAVLQSFLGQEEASQELIQAMVDLSIKTGSLESAAEILGRGVQGNVRGFKQFKIEIDESASKEERLKEITEKVSQKFDGFAASANQGVGSVKGLQTAFGNFLEKIGQRLAPLFEEIVKSLTTFFQTLEQNGPLLDFIVEVGKVVGIITGAITVLAGAALAIVKVQQALLIAKEAMTIFGISARVAVGATGIGILLIVAGELYLNWNKIWPAMSAVFKNFADNLGNIGSGIADILSGIFFPGPSSIAKIKAGYEKLSQVAIDGVKAVRNAGEKESENGGGVEQNQKKLAAARKQQAEEIQLEKTKNERVKAERDLAVLQASDQSKEIIDLKKDEIDTLKKLEDDKYKSQRTALSEHLAEVRALQISQQQDDLERETTFEDTLLEQNKYYQDLTEQQQAEFLTRKQAALLASVETERTARDKVVIELLQKQIAANNKFLEDQQKFGAAYAQINRVIYSDQVQSAAKGFSELANLQQSNNATLKAIGKAAAVADITIKTAQSAMNIFNAFSVIPFIGVPLGIAGAAAAVAFGAEQIGKVVSAQEGGIVPGFNSGGDSVPSVLQPGELVVPRANFSEVVNAVANARNADSPEATAIPPPAVGTQQVSVNLQFSGDNAEKFLTARQVEARSLGTLREASA